MEGIRCRDSQYHKNAPASRFEWQYEVMLSLYVTKAVSLAPSSCSHGVNNNNMVTKSVSANIPSLQTAEQV